MNYEKSLNALNAFNFLFHLDTCIDIDEEYQKHLCSKIMFRLYGSSRFDVIKETDFSNEYMDSEEEYFYRRFESLRYFQELGVIPSYTSENIDPGDACPLSNLEIDIEEFEVIKEIFKQIYHKKYTRKYPVSARFGCFLDLSDEESASIHNENKVLYIVSFPLSNKIILNDLIVLSKPNLDSENAKVFAFLFEHPNVKFTKKQIGEHLGQSVGKSLHKIVENLGFKNDVRKLFFTVSENAIIFRNPIGSNILKELNIKPLQLNIQYKKLEPPPA